MSLFALAAIFSGGASADVWDGTARAWTSGGGTAESPYEIASAANLAYLAQQVNSGTNYRSEYFKLTADIDLNGSARNWTPIGDYSSYVPFRGTFDGDGHTVSNMKVTGDIQYAGLFGYISTGGSVKNLALRDVDVQSSREGAWVGGLVGNNYSSVENVTVTGRVMTTGELARVGGLVGRNQGNITSCASSCAVESAGGAGQFGTGGLVGTQEENTIATSLATGTVTAIGETLGVFVGGFAGNQFNYDPGNIINNSLATGFVKGTTTNFAYVGGFLGVQQTGSCTASAFDSQSTGQVNAEYRGALDGVTSMTTADLTDGTTAVGTFGAASWDVRPGYYPMPKALLESSGTSAGVKSAVAYIAMVMPITLDAGDAVNNVTAPFTIPKKDAAGNDITWSFSSTNALSLDLADADTYTVAWTAPIGELTLSADMPGGTKSFKLVLTGKTANKVTFDSKGGSSVADANVLNGAKVTKPADPTKSGYVLDGWYKEETLVNKWNFDTDTVTQDITLYAKWTDDDGGKIISADEALDILDDDPELADIVSVVSPASEDVLAVSDEIIEIGGLAGTTITEINIVESVPASAFEPRPTSKISGALSDDTRALTPSVYVKIPTENGNVMPLSFTVLEPAISSDLPGGWAAMPDADKANYLAEDADGTATVFAYEYILSDGTATAPVTLIGRGGLYTWAYAIEKGVVTFSDSGDITLNYLAVASGGEPFIAGKFLVIPDKQPNPGYITDPIWLMREAKGNGTPPTGGSSGCASGAGAAALIGLGITLIRRRR